MKNLLLLFLSVEIGFIAAVDVQSPATALADIHHQDIALAGRRLTRQVQPNCTSEQLQNIAFPPRCVAAAQEINEAVLADLDPAALASFGAIFCDPECGNPLLEFFEKCFGDSGELLTVFTIQLCAQNSQGRRCYSEDVTSVIFAGSESLACRNLDINNTCDSACRRVVEDTVAAAGCCINILDSRGQFPVTDFLASTCNVDIPGPCSSSTLGPQGTPRMPTSETMPPTSGSSETVAQAMYIFFGAFTLLMTAAL